MRLRGRAKTKSTRALSTLCKVHLEVPVDEGELERLREALGRMGCVGLLESGRRD